MVDNHKEEKEEKSNNNNKKKKDANDVVVLYLQKLQLYINILSSSDDDDDDNVKREEEEEMSEGADKGMHTIAESLLNACDPAIMSLPLPPQLFHSSDNSDDDDNNDDENDENEEEEKEEKKRREGPQRINRRVDLLRSILRAFSPIALDISVLVSHILIRTLSDTNANKEEKVAAAAKALVLFGAWLPIAPQITPIVSDLFAWTDFVCPFYYYYSPKDDNDNNNNNKMEIDNEEDDDENNGVSAECMQVLAEASHSLCKFYGHRGEHNQMKQWWNWYPLFRLLHLKQRDDDNIHTTTVNNNNDDDDDDDNDDDMDIDESKDEYDETYNLNTQKFPKTGHAPRPYSPLTAIKWHAARAITFLLNLPPKSTYNFLKSESVQENMVPWVLHPWILEEEEEIAQYFMLKNQARIGKIRDDDDDDDDKEKDVFVVPTCEDIRKMVSLDENALVHLGKGIVLPKRNTIVSYLSSSQSQSQPQSQPQLMEVEKEQKQSEEAKLILTPTTSRNLTLLGAALCCNDSYPPPILVCGPRGSGKSSLVRELAHYCSSSSSSNHNDDDDMLLELHVDDETDSKTLLGSYVATDIPGEFAWRPGALTNAVRSGKWILLEDAESCPMEIQAALVKLLEERILPLGVGKNAERAHPNFRIFGTCTTAATTSTTTTTSQSDGKKKALRGSVTTAGSGGKRLLHPSLWRKVHVDPLPYRELCEIGRNLYPTLPVVVSDAALHILRTLDKSGRTEEMTMIVDDDEDDEEEGKEEKKNQDEDEEEEEHDVDMKNVADADAVQPTSESTSPSSSLHLGSGRHASVRDHMKLLSRISHTINFESGGGSAIGRGGETGRSTTITYATESQRILCLAESVDVYAASLPSVEGRREFVTQVAAPAFGVTADAARRYVETRKPTVSTVMNDGRVEVGRARMHLSSPTHENIMMEERKKGPGSSSGGQFAETSHALRLMESAAVCVSQNEPTLLVGETGCGKTTLIQRLASLTKRELIVQNLSLQTDSSDLLGGYRPLEIRQVARKIYVQFVDLFTSTFSRLQNGEFLEYVLAAFEKGQWKRLSQCFRRASKMGLKKMNDLQAKKGKKRSIPDSTTMMNPLATPEAWAAFHAAAQRFERQRSACESGLAFAFTEGALVDAIRTGKWVLLDEINLASSETLQRLCGLLDNVHGSVTLTERGDSEALQRHPDFRLFAAMNPATDAGKKDIPQSMRSRFTEIYVDELVDPVELRSVAARYLSGAIESNNTPLEHSSTIMTAVDVYMRCRHLSEQALVDGGGQRPRYTMRTMCRALAAARNLVLEQRFSPARAVLEGFELAFEGPLDIPSRKALRKTLFSSLGKGLTKKELDHPARRPGGKVEADNFVLNRPFWIKAGPLAQVDWAETSPHKGNSRFVLTPSALSHLRQLSRAVAAGPWPILLEGPTSAGKTTLVEYLAARCGHRCVRINNHEHTDVQEYTGFYAADSKGSLSFKDGLLVQALRKGYWVILDELNLAPSEVLEALNRLLDDNRELYLPEINETVTPHPNFRLFATQNPCGAYGGRKPLSRAFRNRFVEIHIGDIPTDDIITILNLRCGCPPSHAKLLVKVMVALRQRRSKSSVFRGKDGLITPRDLLRWAERGSAASSKSELAMEGYMLLAERLRSADEKEVVKTVIEEQMKAKINCDQVYYDQDSDAQKQLRDIVSDDETIRAAGISLQSIAPTNSLLRLLALVQRCVQHKEPVLLVGDTGCGKTTVVQLMSVLFQRHLHVINCHASTETSDILGGLRPLRGRDGILREMVQMTLSLMGKVPDHDCLQKVPNFLLQEKERLCSSVQDSPIMKHQGSEKVAYPSNAAELIVSFVRSLQQAYIQKEANANSIQHCEKKRKLETGDAILISGNTSREDLKSLIKAIELLYQKHSSLFEWIDGPLVNAMKKGQLLLLDEMSLAEDAVLERLNSVLEPSRLLVLAEKGGEVSLESYKEQPSEFQNTEIRAHDNFRIFATMNPGGDFGKRELSPALRSRFTEIWVPAVTDRYSIDLVVEKTLSLTEKDESVVKPISKKLLDQIRTKMLDYVEWFNQSICGDPTSALADLTLSLRDVLTWARFILDVYVKDDSTNIWLAYAHGASLMHLDGLGLGTGLSRDDVRGTRQMAKKLIKDQIPLEDRNTSTVGFDDELKGIENVYHSGNNTFGVHPFFIPIGSKEIPKELKFSLTAPTTGMNMRRVLRALQLSKPVLLEGSPGVGKTSLISALAVASGHKLVRINLSEQTDISDLMGSDLPTPVETESENRGKNGSGSSSTVFRWCDGVLLKAIKQGDWVLLDELNLASQSVLEGLNSCLDHRANVFIPELGQTFDLPPTFRIFAAQNPLVQGGGRKGLPKSFLNRFTKVYVEALLPDDLKNIMMSRFPSIPPQLVSKMVSFNSAVQHDVMETHEYGQLGSPWEFNLRDMFRWCELIENGGDVSPDVFAEIIYLQRFRTTTDRVMLSQRYKKYMEHSIRAQRYPEVIITDTHVKVGGALLQRSTYHPKCYTKGNTPHIYQSLNRSMEAVAYCVQKDWPCLLVGPASSGKSTLLRSLSESCNMQLEEVSLTSSTDVTELIGCFEQVDCTEAPNNILHILEKCHNTACQILHGYTNFTKLCRLYRIIIEKTSKASFLAENELPLATSVELVKLFEHCANENPDFQEACGDDISSAIDLIAVIQNHGSKASAGSHFRWVDGILVKAMERGDWLHLENVNFCPASVLDRLNPIMEQGGELILAECSVACDDHNRPQQAHRVVTRHPNFRLFLSMNPGFGEVSRAMRNRCIEISLISLKGSEMSLPQGNIESNSKNLPTTLSKPNAPSEGLDYMSCLWSSGVRSFSLVQFALMHHKAECLHSEGNAEDSPLTRNLRDCGALTTGLLKRGWNGSTAIKTSLRIAYENHEHDGVSKTFLADKTFNDSRAVASGIDLRNTWAVDPPYAHVTHDARLLKLMNYRTCQQSIPFELNHMILIDNSQGIARQYNKVCPQLRAENNMSSKIRSYLLAQYICKMSLADTKIRASFMEGYCSTDSRSSKAMMLRLERMLSKVDAFKLVMMSRNDDAYPALDTIGRIPNTPEQQAKISKCLDYLHVVCVDRLSHFLEEQQTYEHFKSDEFSSALLKKMGAIEVSFCLHEGKVDRSSVNCPVTPVLFPLFKTIDKFVGTWEIDFIEKEHFAFEEELSALRRFLSCRDRLWSCLKNSRYLSSQLHCLGFDESGFLVQWVWIKKAFKLFLKNIQTNMIESEAFESAMRQVELLFGKIDRGIYEGTGSTLSSDVIWKRGGHPYVPSLAKDWDVLDRLKNCSRSLSLIEEIASGANTHAGARKTICLDQLVKLNHPCLFINEDIKSDLLGTLCITHWATTDETRGINRGADKVHFLDSAPYTLEKRIYEAKQQYAANVNSLIIDRNINTIDNKLALEEIESINNNILAEKKDQNLVQDLLKRFGEIQVTQLNEIWCVHEEGSIIGNIAKIILTRRNQEEVLMKCIRSIAPKIKKFICIASSKTLWSLSDLRPYQTFLWAIECPSLSASSLYHLLKSIFPLMMSSASQHLWCNSFNNLECVSDELVSPRFWKDGFETINESSSSSFPCEICDIFAENAGPRRLKQPLRTTAIFRLLGCAKYTSSLAPHLTLENWKARRNQSEMIMRHLAVMPYKNEQDLSSFTVQYLFANLMEAMGYKFDGVHSSMTSLGLCIAEEESVELFLKTSEHTFFQQNYSNVVQPLLMALRSINTKDISIKLRQEQEALVWLYVGVIRLHLFLPSSPMDPGKKPAAKVSQLDDYLLDIGCKLWSIRLQSGFDQGDFAPNHQKSRQLIKEAEEVSKKRMKQDKKRVERPAKAPSFLSLFQESHRFARTVASVDSVIDLIDSIQSAENCQEQASSASSKETNWQRSSSVFCNRLLSHYVAYEDVTVPIANSIRNIQYGLRELSRIHTIKRTKESERIIQLQDHLLQYPIGNLFETLSFDSIPAALESVWNQMKIVVGKSSSSEKRVPRKCHLSLILSSLAQMDVQQRARKERAGREIIEIFERSISSILTLCDGNQELSTQHQTAEKGNITEHSTETEDDRLERIFREQFPDHAKEFCEIVESIEYADDDALTESINSKETYADTTELTLSDHEISFLCELHNDVFLDAVKCINDQCRIRAFKLGYDAASQLGLMTQWMEKKQSNSKSTGAHMMALCLNTVTGTKASLVLTGSAQRADFHHDPNPTEVLKADAPLQRLLVRIGQLHRAFPGNSILLSVGQVAERMRQLDLNDVSVGKVLSGLEVILRKAQEWEQHASKRVTLGAPLKELSALISQWRKIELQSWPQLLDLREHQHILKTRRHWVRLYKLVIDENRKLSYDASGIKPKMSTLFECPHWVCKGNKALSSGSDECCDLAGTQTSSLNEFVKCIDTFVLTAGIADFPERLRMIESFANHIMRKCEMMPKSSQSLALARTLRSLWEYYNQFAPYVLSVKDKLRAPIEKSLKDEAKIAKWDEQTYYSLAESADKSHRKLMKHLRDYDSEVLEVNVGVILEQHFLKGVRSSSNTENQTQEPVTSVPRDDEIFPHLKSNIALKEKGEGQTKQMPNTSDFIPRNSSHIWMHEDLSTLSNDYLQSKDKKYLFKMKSYYSTMGKLLSNDEKTGTWANHGSNEATIMCETIFSRIAALRGEKATKNMKQRALVDLFKVLKKHGYSSMKWSVPSEMRTMSNILQMPSPARKSLSSVEATNLEQAEGYFYRCTLELNRLRDEISLFGSKHMSQREMLLMTGFSEHGFFMLCQQRCLLSKVIEEVASIDQVLGSFGAIGQSLPLAQGETKELVSRFENSFISSKENIYQLLLLMKASMPFAKEQGHVEKLRDAVSVVEGCISRLSGAYKPIQPNFPITYESINQIIAAKGLLENVRRNISEQCKGSEYLPIEVYEPCLCVIDDAISLATLLAEPVKVGDSVCNGINETLQTVSYIVESSLLSIQGICQNSEDDCNQPKHTLWENHRRMSSEWYAINLRRIKMQLEELNANIILLHESDKVASKELFLCLGASGDACTLVHRVILASKKRLEDFIFFFRNMAKLTYILIRIFRVLVAKGFCADDVDDNADGDGDGDVSNMKFEDDVEGTGMGEGDGKNDVTDQIENEEQLLGLKGDDGGENEKRDDQKQLNDEEAEQGMEMDADFEGEMFDVPQEEDANEESDKNEEEEELDREMGDGNDPNENVVDEKMWDDNDDDELDNHGEEKFEKDSKMAGGPQEDELRTKEDDEGNNDDKGANNDDSKEDENSGSNDSEKEKKENTAEDNIDHHDEMQDEVVNDDTEDKYEEKNENVEVRGNDEDFGPDDENEEGMDLTDELNLDDGAEDEDEKDGDGNTELDGANPEEGEEETNSATEDNTADQNEDNDKDEDEDGNEVQQASIPAGGDGDAHEENEDKDDQTEDEESPKLDMSEQHMQNQDKNDVQGISCENGADSAEKFEENDKDNDGDRAADTNEAYGRTDEMDADEEQNLGDEGSTGEDGKWQSGDGRQTESTSDSNTMDAPNPLIDPGNAEEFWHKKLDMIQSSGGDDDNDPKDDKETGEEGFDDDAPKDGVFEYTEKKDQSTTQVLGGAADEDATKLDDSIEEDTENQTKQEEGRKLQDSKKQNTPQEKGKSRKRETQPSTDRHEHMETSDNEEELEEETSAGSESEQDDSSENDITVENKVFTDISQLNISEDKSNMLTNTHKLTEVEQVTGISSAEATEARLQWSQIQANTINLSRRLCEKLRLVMEPLVATKLRGDYRTGKRINMKRVIGYIASGYRKDKIWLRRTKPSKRNYRVLLAVDDSESMQKSGAGDMALAALAVLSNGMNQLEIGELGVASFGEEMRLLHGFHQPFTSESGPALVSNFTFDEKRTRMALCVESAIEALEADADSSCSMKLVFLISDGRIERDSRAKLRKLVREMTEKNILLVVIIVEGDATAKKKKKDSIVNMKEVTFENGKPKVKYFIEDYPFPYYMILEEMSSLPEVLGDALRQWFEMITQIQSQGTGY